MVGTFHQEKIHRQISGAEGEKNDDNLACVFDGQSDANVISKLDHGEDFSRDFRAPATWFNVMPRAWTPLRAEERDADGLRFRRIFSL